MSKIEYKHRSLKDAIFNLCCLAHIGVNDKTLIENLNADCERELTLYEDLKTRYSKLYQAIEIIKEKPQATLWLFQHCDKKMEYEDMISLFKEDITKEQFDLLKEVLL